VAGVPTVGPLWPLEVSWLVATPTGGWAGSRGDTGTVGQPEGPGSHHGADPGDHAYAPALGCEQRGIAVGEAKRYVAELSHCLPHVEVGETGTGHVGHLRRDRRVRDVEFERGPGFLGHQGQVDLAVAGQCQRLWWITCNGVGRVVPTSFSGGVPSAIFEATSQKES